MSDAGNWGDIDRIDTLARRDTPIHQLDTRAKILVMLAFCTAVVSFPRHAVSALTPFAVFPLAMAAAGHVPFRFLARRLLFAAPFIVVVGIANPWFDRRPMLEIAGLALTGGWLSFTSLLLRGVLTVTAVVAVVACTGMHAFCDGLRRLGVPAILCSQLDLLHRYLFVVGDEARRMQRAASLRVPAAAACGQTPRRRMRGSPLRVYASLLGSLLLRSMDRAGRVHQAMLSRGYAPHSASVVAPTRRWTARDAAFALGWLAFFVAARSTDLAAAFGRLLLGDIA